MRRMLVRAAIAGAAVLACCVIASPVQSGPARAPGMRPTAGTPVLGAYVPLTPAVVLDTRKGIGAAKHPLYPNNPIDIGLVGRGGMPASAMAAVLTVTVTNAKASGWLADLPLSNFGIPVGVVAFEAHQTVTNQVVTSAGGANFGAEFTLHSASTADVVASVSGYYASTNCCSDARAGALYSLQPARVFDTRYGIGAPKGAVAGGHTIVVTVPASIQDPPAQGVIGLDLSAMEATSGGAVIAYPHGSARQSASVLNFNAGRSVTTFALVRMSDDRKIDLYVSSRGAVQLRADWFAGVDVGSPTESGTYRSLPASVVADTRHAVGLPLARIPAGHTVTVPVAGRGGVPATGASAVALNVVSIGHTGSGSLVVRPDGASMASGGISNYAAGQTNPGFVITPVGADGKIAIRASGTGDLDVVVIVEGYYLDGTNPKTFTWTTPAPIGVATGYRRSISCASTTFCMLADQNKLVNLFNGSSWTALATAPVGVMSLACGSSTFCMATAFTSWLTWNGATWTVGPVGNAPAVVYECPTTTFCVGTDAGDLLTYNGTTWSVAVAEPTSVGFFVTCIGTSFCVATDSLGNETRFNGSVWSPLTPTRVGVVGSFGCTTVLSCVSDQGDVFDGNVWHRRPLQFVDATLGQVHCDVAAQLCTAISSAPSGVAIYDGYGWTDPAPTGNTSQMNVACASASFCVLVDLNSKVQYATR